VNSPSAHVRASPCRRSGWPGWPARASSCASGGGGRRARQQAAEISPRSGRASRGQASLSQGGAGRRHPQIRSALAVADPVTFRTSSLRTGGILPEPRGRDPGRERRDRHAAARSAPARRRGRGARAEPQVRRCRRSSSGRDLAGRGRQPAAPAGGIVFTCSSDGRSIETCRKCGPGRRRAGAGDGRRIRHRPATRISARWPARWSAGRGRRYRPGRRLGRRGGPVGTRCGCWGGARSGRQLPLAAVIECALAGGADPRRRGRVLRRRQWRPERNARRRRPSAGAPAPHAARARACRRRS
jgi:hypothetical protein